VEKIVFKRIGHYLFIVASFTILFLSSCAADLGVFSEEETFDKYYDSFGDVIGIYDDNGTISDISYDFEDSIFNEDIMNNLEWEDEDDEVLYQNYIYIVIPVEANLKIESIALFLARDESEENDVELEISLFYFPAYIGMINQERIKLISSPDTEMVDAKDEQGNDIQVEQTIEYADPDVSSRLAYDTYLVTTEWEDGILLDNFTQEEYLGYYCVQEGYLMVQEGGYICLRIENNSGLRKGTLEPCKISFMNLLIRAV